MSTTRTFFIVDDDIDDQLQVFLVGDVAGSLEVDEVGVRLADRLSFTFLDTDDLITQRAGMTIKDIFARHGVVDYRITAQERTWFKRCRRQWDFASPHRRNLRSLAFVQPALPVALKDALAVYYYPGTWDWQHEVTQPLVHKALERSLDDADATDMLHKAAALLDCYDAWANVVDDFAPGRPGAPNCLSARDWRQWRSSCPRATSCARAKDCMCGSPPFACSRRSRDAANLTARS